MNKYCFSLFLAAVVLSGCGYEGIFDGRDKDVLAPLDPSVAFGNDKYDNFFKDGSFNYLCNTLFVELMSEDQISSGMNDYAVVLNDTQLLHEVQTEGGQVYQWPDIDFENYSLVVGRWMDVGTTWYIKDQRAKKSPLGKVTIYLHFVKHEGGAFQQPRFRLFGAIYPKLPSGVAEIVRWEEDVVIPLSE